MNNLWEYIKGLFQSAEESSATNPAVHEMIRRSEEEKADYDHWKNTLVCRRLLDWLQDQYAIYTVLPDDIDEAIDFLNLPSSKGFVIHFHKTQYSRRDATHFLDYLKERVLALNYRTQISDMRSFSERDWVETIERHYLKPRPDFGSKEPLEQRFGNIMIESHLRNDRPHYLKFSATSYKDRLFNEPEEFKKLMQDMLV
jgi:hypothetical protein